MSNVTRKRASKPDARGHLRPYIGKRKCGKQPRFNLGTPGHEAEQREQRIRQLYLESVSVRKQYGLQPSWTEAALYAAKEIQHGLLQVPVPAPDMLNEAAGDDQDIGEYSCSWTGRNPYGLIWSHSVVSRHYPSVNWVLPEGQTSQDAVAFGQKVFDVHASQQAGMMNAEVPDKPVAGTLHEALNAYEQYLHDDVSRRVQASTLGKRLDQTKYIKNETPDTPLAFIGLSACREMISRWTGRPEKPNGNGEKYARSYCKHRVSELSMFFNWLHTSEQFDWRKPEDFETIKKAIARDRERNPIHKYRHKKTFSVDALKKIHHECRTLERLLLLLGLNCSFGAAESGRLTIEDYFLRQPNPISHAWEQTPLTVDETGNWIGYLRPKSLVAGCWSLWPETVDAIDRWMTERPESQTNLLIVTSDGTPLYRDHSKNAQSGFSNLWKRLITRVQRQHSDVPQLPFGSLRDHFPNWCVQRGESDVASLALAHGSPFKDDLLSSYADRPFPRLFEFQRQYREWLQPMFDRD